MLNYWMEVTDPFRVLDEVRRQIDRAYQGPSFTRQRRRPPLAWPSFHVREHGDGYELVGLVPGLGEGDIKINATASTLTVSGERALAAPEGYTAHRQERAPYKFTRTIDLPSNFSLDLDKITAVVKDGVLRVSLPRSAESKPRSITVTTG